jgi:hypothetical protein
MSFAILLASFREAHRLLAVAYAAGEIRIQLHAGQQRRADLTGYKRDPAPATRRSTVYRNLATLILQVAQASQ